MDRQRNRALFYTRDSGGRHEMTRQYVTWAANRAGAALDRPRRRRTGQAVGGQWETGRFRPGLHDRAGAAGQAGSTVSPTSLLDVPAPAKLNLFLHITGRRADGYHLLQSVFVLIDWADTLHFERRADGALRRHDLSQTLPADDLQRQGDEAAHATRSGTPSAR